MLAEVDLVLKNAKVWTSTGLQEGGLAVKDGKIAAIAKDYGLPAAGRTIDANGNLIIPGFVDEHVHMGDPWVGPGKEVAVMREDFAYGTMAAAAGGITTVIEMPDSMPLVTQLDVAKTKLDVCRRKAYVDFGLHGGFIPDTDYARGIKELYQFGLTGLKTFTCFSIPEWPPCYDGDLYEALKIIHDVGAVALLHAENDFILSANEKRLRNQGRTDIRAHLEWRTPVAEIESDRRMVFFLKETHAKGLIVHTSVPEGVLEVKAARDEGYEIYVETCPHFLFQTDEDVVKKGPWAKTAPPSRDKERVAKMWQLLNLGYIDTLGSDHSPYTKEEKIAGLKNIWNAGNGAASIEATLPLMLDAVNDGRTTMQRLIQVACENPAKLWGLYPRKGALQVGSDADFVVVDMKAKHKLSNDTTKSKCGWTVYDGTVTQGAPKMTFVRGSAIMQDGEIVGKQGYGQFVSRQNL
jgi:allantoinase